MSLCALCSASAAARENDCLGCNLAAQAKGANARANRAEEALLKVNDIHDQAEAALQRRAEVAEARAGLFASLLGDVSKYIGRDDVGEREEPLRGIVYAARGLADRCKRAEDELARLREQMYGPPSTPTLPPAGSRL